MTGCLKSIKAKVGGETEGQTAHKDEKTGLQLFGGNRGDAEVTSGKPLVTEPFPPLGFMPIWSSKGGVTIARLTHGLSHPMVSTQIGRADAWVQLKALGHLMTSTPSGRAEARMQLKAPSHLVTSTHKPGRR